MRWILLLSLLAAPVGARAADELDAAAGGGAAVVVVGGAATALVTRRRRRRNAVIAREAERWGWSEERQRHELAALARRSSLKARVIRRGPRRRP